MKAVTDAPAGPPEPNAAVLLVALGRRARIKLDEVLAPYQIGYRHLSALGHLATSEEISYSDLARRASVTAQSMRATLAHLEELGIVEHAGAIGQGKRARLAVTAEGQRLLATCRDALAEAEAEILAGLAPKRQALLRGLLAELFISTSPVRKSPWPTADGKAVLPRACRLRMAPAGCAASPARQRAQSACPGSAARNRSAGSE